MTFIYIYSTRYAWLGGQPRQKSLPANNPNRQQRRRPLQTPRVSDSSSFTVIDAFLDSPSFCIFQLSLSFTSLNTVLAFCLSAKMNWPDEELHHPLRQDLINKLHEALDRPIIDSAAKALLWFSDIEQLRGLLEDTLNTRTREGLLMNLTSKDYARALRTCRFLTHKSSRTHGFLYLIMTCYMLILYRIGATRTRPRSNILGKRNTPDDAGEASSAQRQAGPKTAVGLTYCDYMFVLTTTRPWREMAKRVS